MTQFSPRFSRVPVQRQLSHPMGFPFHSAWSSRWQEYQATFPVCEKFTRRSMILKSVALKASFIHERFPNSLKAENPTIVLRESGWKMKKSSSCATMENRRSISLFDAQPIASVMHRSTSNQSFSSTMLISFRHTLNPPIWCCYSIIQKKSPWLSRIFLFPSGSWYRKI